MFFKSDDKSYIELLYLTILCAFVLIQLCCAAGIFNVGGEKTGALLCRLECNLVFLCFNCPYYAHFVSKKKRIHSTQFSLKLII